MSLPRDDMKIIIPRWWQPALIAAALLAYTDTARYLRRDDWISPNVEGLGGFVAAGAVYFLIVGAGAFAGYQVAARIRATAVSATYGSAIGAAIAAAVLIAIGSSAGGMRMPIYAAIALLNGLVVIAWAVLSAKTARPGVLTAAFASALVAATVALMAFQHPFVFDDNRPTLSLAASAIYGLVTLAAVLLAGRGCATGRASAVGIVLAVAAVGPAVIEGLGAVERDEPVVADERPNLLLIVSDTLRADYCSVNGGPVPTPWLERLAARGAHFEQAYSLAPWTLPSMIGMFSSGYPPSFEAGDLKEEALRGLFSYTVPTTQYTLAERLHMEGYGTAAFIGNALLDRQTGVLRGFEVAKARARAWPYTQTRGGVFARAPMLHDAVSLAAPTVAFERRIDTTGILTGYARTWLARRDQTRPFFLYVHYMDPHAPYTPPEAYRVSPIGWPYNADPPLSDHTGQPLSPEQLEYVADYAGEIRYVDASAGTLLEGAGNAVTRNTLVVFTSDHGEEFWDHGAVAHGHTLYQEQIHVPMIITGLRVAEQRIPEAFSHIDLMPTLAGLMGVEPEGAWRGEDRSEWLLGGDAPDFLPPVFAQSTMLRSKHGPLQTVIDEGIKRIRSREDVPGWLFDLAHDPGELENIEEREPAKTGRLDSRLDAWERLFPSTFQQLIDTGETDERVYRERLEHMEALGYL